MHQESTPTNHLKHTVCGSMTYINPPSDAQHIHPGSTQTQHVMHCVYIRTHPNPSSNTACVLKACNNPLSRTHMCALMNQDDLSSNTVCARGPMQTHHLVHTVHITDPHQPVIRCHRMHQGHTAIHHLTPFVCMRDPRQPVI